MESGKHNVLIAMMMLAVILMVWTRATQAALEVVEQAYEMDVSLVERWPLGDNDSLIFRPCRNCDRVVLRVDALTRYGRSLDGNEITRDELLRLKSLLGSNAAFVYVFYRPDTGIATQVVLDVGE